MLEPSVSTRGRRCPATALTADAVRNERTPAHEESGVLTLRTASAVKAVAGERRPRVLTLGSSKYLLSGGSRTHIDVRLSTSARKLLARSGQLLVRVRVVPSSGRETTVREWVRILSKARRGA